MRADNICNYDERYTKSDAEEIGFCVNCNSKKCDKAPILNFGKSAGKEAVKRMIREFHIWEATRNNENTN